MKDIFIIWLSLAFNLATLAYNLWVLNATKKAISTHIDDLKAIDRYYLK